MKKTLIVVDMQNDFIYGPLGNADARAIIGKVKNKIDAYQAAGDEIIFTRDTHQPDYLKTNEGKHLPVEHCFEGTEGWQVLSELQVPGAIYVDKKNFGYPDWKKYNLEEVELVGIYSDICVVSNALILKALYPEIRISLDASCCAGVTPESHQAALLTMKMCQVEVCTPDENI